MKGMRNIALTILLFCSSIAAWELIVRVFEVPTFIFPAPSKVAMALWRGFASGLYQKHLAHTLLETVLGFLLGSALGFFLGTAVALSRYVEYFFYPYIVMFQSLPKVALAPLIVVWFGLGLKSQVLNAALVAFFPLLVNTMVGLKSTDEDRMNLMRSLAASESQIFWMLRLPNALPFVMAGLDVAMIFALIGAIVAEFVGARAGLGMLIQSMNFNMDVSGQFSVLLILSVVGLLLNRCILLIRRRVLFWDPSEKERLERERIVHMKRTLIALVLTCFLVAVSCANVLAQTSKLRVGFCSRVISSAAAPFAIATKMGWYKEDGVEVELAALAGSADCVKTTATKEIPFSLPSVEPLAAARTQGIKAKIFYTAYQGNIYGIAVPADSPIQKITDLKGKTHRRHQHGHRRGAGREGSDCNGRDESG